jgi:hypothetical protein
MSETTPLVQHTVRTSQSSPHSPRTATAATDNFISRAKRLAALLYASPEAIGVAVLVLIISLVFATGLLQVRIVESQGSCSAFRVVRNSPTTDAAVVQQHDSADTADAATATASAATTEL